METRTLTSRTTVLDNKISEEQKENDEDSALYVKIEEKENVRHEQHSLHHKTKTNSWDQCKKFDELSFEERKDLLFKS